MSATLKTRHIVQFCLWHPKPFKYLIIYDSFSFSVSELARCAYGGATDVMELPLRC